MNLCQARGSQEASDEEKENPNEEKSEYEIESENENGEVEPDKKRQVPFNVGLDGIMEYEIQICSLTDLKILKPDMVKGLTVKL